MREGPRVSAVFAEVVLGAARSVQLIGALGSRVDDHDDERRACALRA